MKSLTRLRLFYGWWVALTLAVAIFFAHGIGFYVFAVMIKPLVEEFGWSRTAVTGVVTIYTLARGVVAPGVGRMSDRYGARLVMLLSVPVFGGALILLSLTQSLWQLYVIYFLLSVAATGLQTVPISTAIARWFVRRRGTAMGLTLAGMNLGGFIMAPFAAFLTQGWGWRVAFISLGLLSWLFLLPLVSLVMRSRPEDKGLLPDGEAQPRAAPPRPQATAPDHPPPQPHLLRSPAFWLTSFSFFLVTGCFVGVLTHQVIYLTQTGITPVLAATALGFTSGFGIIGKLIAGYLADRLPKALTAAIFFALQGVGLLLLMGAKNMAMVWLFTIVFGMGMAATPVVYTLVVAEFFGAATIGSTYGLTLFFSSFGAAAGAPFAGYIYDHTGSYFPAFTVFLLVYLLAIFSLFLASRLRRQGLLLPG